LVRRSVEGFGLVFPPVMQIEPRALHILGNVLPLSHSPSPDSFFVAITEF
jgi:hypothetical protein